MKHMTLREAQAAFPIGSDVRIIKTGQIVRVDDVQAYVVASIGRRVFVEVASASGRYAECLVPSQIEAVK